MDENATTAAEPPDRTGPASGPTLRLRRAPGGLGILAAALAALYPVVLTAAALLAWLTAAGPAAAIG